MPATRWAERFRLLTEAELDEPDVRAPVHASLPDPSLPQPVLPQGYGAAGGVRAALSGVPGDAAARLIWLFFSSSGGLGVRTQATSWKF